MPSKPLPAFPGVEPSLASPELGVYTWLCEPAGMVNRFADGTHVDTAQTDFIITTAFEAMRRAFSAASRFYFVHDFSSVQGYSSGARQALTEWGKRTQQAGLVEQVVLIPPRMGALGTMAVDTAVLTLRMFGQKIETAPDLTTAIARLGVRAAR